MVCKEAPVAYSVMNVTSGYHQIEVAHLVNEVNVNTRTHVLDIDSS